MSSSPPSSRSSSPPRDPLERLTARIEEAKIRVPAAPDETHDFSAEETVIEREGGDPIDRLRARLERAHPARALREASESLASAPPPLDALYEQIRRARALDLPLELPESLRRDPNDDPLEHLGTILAREIDEVGERPTVALVRSRDDVAGEQTESGGLKRTADALVGRRILEVLADEPLAGEVRVEAIRRLAAQLDDPDREELEAILRLLLR